MYYALIKNSVVENTIVDNDGSFVGSIKKQYDQILQVNSDGFPTAGVGYTYNGAIFVAPVVEEVVAVARTQITGSEIRAALTTNEKVNMEINSLDDPTATVAARSTAAKLRVFLKDLDANTVFTVADAKTRLESVGFEDQRIEEILK
jgi:hypothetical protein